MSLGSVVAAYLPYLRGEAESRFTETFTAFRSTKVLNPSTGLYEDTEVVLYAAVPGRVRFPTLTVSEQEQGAQVPAIQDVQVHVAVGATPDVGVGHSWRVDASTADSSLVGREFSVKGLPQAGQTTAHRYPVEQVA